MAEGTTNEQGIYVYTEDDKPSLFSALLNRLGSSVTTVVRSLSNRVREIEENLPAPLAAGRYDCVLPNLANGVLTRFPAMLINYNESSTAAPVLWEPVTGPGAGAMRFKKSGIYQVSIRVEATNAFFGRIFVNVGPQRFGQALEAEHQTTLTGTIVINTDNEVLAFLAYQASGGSRAVTYETTIVRLGDFG